MYDKIYKGTFVGGNLTTAIKAKTKTGGAVIWGGVRDVEQMKQVEDVQVYYRGIDPTPIRDFIMKDYNSVTRIGKATVLPGDIVFGGGGGVLFIPSHLVAEVVDGAAKTHVKDDFGFEMIAQNKFTTAQIDRATWTEEMLDMLVEWIKPTLAAKNIAISTGRPNTTRLVTATRTIHRQCFKQIKKITKRRAYAFRDCPLRMNKVN